LLTTKDTTNQIGTVQIKGITLTKYEGIVSITNIPNTSNILINLQSALNSALIANGYSTSAVAGIARINYIDLVNAVIPAQEVISTVAKYDLKNIQLQYNVFNDAWIQENSALLPYQVVLPQTINNKANLPSYSYQLSVSFYFYVVGDSEILSFPRNTTLYSTKKYVTVDSIKTISGFNKTNSTLLTASLLTQPLQNGRYTATYSYIAPKQNERISITYNYNGVIGSCTTALERARTPNEDVLAKASAVIYVDISLSISVLATYTNTSETVRQNVYAAIITASTLTKLGSVLNYSNIVATAQGVVGVDSVQVQLFNKTGSIGIVQTVTSQNNQYILPNNLVVTLQ
jgi:hypothetical protein